MNDPMSIREGRPRGLRGTHSAIQRLLQEVGCLIVTVCLAGCPASSGPPISNPDVVDVPGIIRTIAGMGAAGFAGDGGPAARARLNQPMDVVRGPDGATWIADFGNHRIRRVDSVTDSITTVAGTGNRTGTDALSFPSGITVLDEGRFLVASWGDNAVYEYLSDGSRISRLGNSSADCAEAAPDSMPQQTPVYRPRNIAVMADGSLLVAEQGCHRVRRATPIAVATYAGVGDPGYSGDGGAASAASLNAGSLENGPALGISLSPEDPPDELFIADTQNHVIRQVKLFTGRMETLAGTGEPGFVDGPPDRARFNRPTYVFASSDHAVWIVDAGNHAIRRLDPLGIEVETIAGTGVAGFNGDGIPAIEAQLDNPSGLFVATSGEVLIADTGNHRIRRITPASPQQQRSSP